MKLTIDVADRVDKALARFYPAAGRRQLAQLFADGAVRLNGRRASKGDRVAIGDTVELTLHAARRTLRVTGLADRRGSASAASALYAETPESIAVRELDDQQRRLAKPLGADLGERPSKRDRRRLEALRRGQQRRAR